MKSLKEQFEDFARSKNPNEEYDYHKPRECACAQFAKTIGMEERYILGIAGRDNYARAIFVPMEIIAMHTPHTWGGIVDRIEEIKK